MNDLLSLVVTVRPEEDVTISASTASSIYALLLRWLGSYDSALATHWHDANGHKPFACSGLVGARRAQRDRLLLSADSTYWFRLCALSGDISAILRMIADSPPQSLTLDEHSFTVEGMTSDPLAHPWAGETSYERLSAPHLLAKAIPLRQVHLRFVTPTFFRQNTMTTPIPLPELVFGSLCDRWNAFSPVAVSDGVREYAAQCMMFGRYDLRSRLFFNRQDIPHPGAVGHARYVGVRHDRYWMSVVALLADYAFYAGVGRSTTIGGGQTRRITQDEAHANGDSGEDEN